LSEGQPYHYSAEDIQHYLEGKMNAADMHALEKQAMDDPFLATAIEGYKTSGTGVQPDLDILRSRLQERTEDQAKKPAVGWLTVASAAALVISLSFGAWLMFGQDEQKQIAKTEISEAKEAIPERPVADSKAKNNKETAPAAPAEKSIAISKQKEVETRAPADLPTNKKSLAKAEEPSPIAAVPEPLAAPQADVPSESTAGAESKALPKAGRPRALVGTLERGAQPVDGWAAFESYLAKNLRRPSGKSAGLHGKVTVSFLINRETGKPYDLKVERALHPDYDAEAIRVLKDGPAWRPVSADSAVRTTHIIEF
jgi:outer membrane biosynthesis protein TonB